MNSIYVSKKDPTKFSSITEALIEAQKYASNPVTIYISDGVYKENVEITQDHITLVGESSKNTILTYDHYARFIMPDGEKRGTFRSMSVFVNADYFSAKNLTFENSAGRGEEVGQALAIYVDSDKSIFENCRFLGSQDTIFTAPLPLKEKEKNGFRGPKQFEPRRNTYQLYRNCYIEGGVDFIFGGATAYFDQCELFSKNEGKEINGYVTAASTPENSPYGYVFNHCRFTSDCPKATCYLGRPWRDYAKTVILNSELQGHIHPEGFHDWGKTEAHNTIYYAEYKNYGEGAETSNRAAFVKQLSESEAKQYTIQNVLGDWAIQ